MVHFPGKLGSTGINELYQLQASNNPLVRTLTTKYKQVSSWEEGMRLMSEGSYAYANSLISSEYNIRTQFTDKSTLKYPIPMQRILILILLDLAILMCTL